MLVIPVNKRVKQENKEFETSFGQVRNQRPNWAIWDSVLKNQNSYYQILQYYQELRSLSVSFEFMCLCSFHTKFSWERLTLHLWCPEYLFHPPPPSNVNSLLIEIIMIVLWPVSSLDAACVKILFSAHLFNSSQTALFLYFGPLAPRLSPSLRLLTSKHLFGVATQRGRLQTSGRCSWECYNMRTWGSS